MFVGFAGLIVILMAAVYALTYVIPAWAAALAIGVLIAVIGAGLTLSGIKMLSLSKLMPERTTRNVRQDAHLVKEHV
jgi:predicted phage tail protein